MKKLTKIVVVIMIAVFTLCLFACTGEEGNVTLVVAGNETKTYNVDTTGKELSTLKDLMDYLVENDQFSYEETGGFVTVVNDKIPNANEFWGIYTDLVIGEIEYFDMEWGTEVDGKMYGSASQGIEDLPLSSGTTYIFKIATTE